MQFQLNQDQNLTTALVALRNIKPTWITLRVITGSVSIAKSKAEAELGFGIPIDHTDDFPQFQGWWAGDLWLIAGEIPAVVNIILCSDQVVTS